MVVVTVTVTVRPASDCDTPTSELELCARRTPCEVGPSLVIQWCSVVVWRGTLYSLRVTHKSEYKAVRTEYTQWGYHASQLCALWLKVCGHTASMAKLPCTCRWAIITALWPHGLHGQATSPPSSGCHCYSSSGSGCHCCDCHASGCHWASSNLTAPWSRPLLGQAASPPNTRKLKMERVWYPRPHPNPNPCPCPTLCMSAKSSA